MGFNDEIFSFSKMDINALYSEVHLMHSAFSLAIGGIKGDTINEMPQALQLIMKWRKFDLTWQSGSSNCLTHSRSNDPCITKETDKLI